MPSSAFGKPNRMYDAVLPLRLLLLKLWDKKVYRLVRLLLLLLLLQVLLLLFLLTFLFLLQVCLLMDHKEDQSPGQQRKQTQIAELIRNTWGFSKDFSVNEVRTSSHIILLYHDQICPRCVMFSAF